MTEQAETRGSTGTLSESIPNPRPVTDIAERRQETAGAKKPIGDISDREIQEWKESRSGIPGIRFAAGMAELIREGSYDGGKEICPEQHRPMLFREITKETFERAMNMLIERNMVRREGNSYYVADGPGEKQHLGWSYEMLSGLRHAAVEVRDSGFPWRHENARLEDIIDRIDATITNKREDAERREPEAGGKRQ